MTEEIYIPPSNDFIEYLLTEVFDVSPDIFNFVVDEFNIQDNHTIIIPKGKRYELKATTKSGMRILVKLSFNGYYFNKDNVINGDIDGNFTVEGLIFINDDQRDRFAKRIEELKKLSLPLNHAPLDVIQSVMQYLTGKDVLALCHMSKRIAQFCNSNVGANIFRNLIIQKDPKYEKYIIPGREKEYYIKILKGLDDFWERHLDKVDWKEISKNPGLSEDFFERHFDKVDWKEMSKNSSLSEDFWEKHVDQKEIYWFFLSKNPSISEAFIEKHINKINWQSLSSNPNISEEFVNKHLDKMTWPGLSGNSSLSEEFFESNLETVEWGNLSQNPSISEEFFEKYIQFVDWNWISRNPGLSEEFFERHIDRALNWRFLSENPSLSEEFFKRDVDRIQWIWSNPNISEEFVESNLDIVNWTQLSENPNLSEEFFQKYIEFAKWYVLVRNTGLSPEFFENHIDSIGRSRNQWATLSRNPMTIKLDP